MSLAIPDTVALYVHWPYCARICPYCDFNVHRVRGDAALVPAILADMAGQRELTGPRRLTSVHFGGGTPSLMEARDVAAIVERADALWGLEAGAEVALEANPALVDRARVEGFASAGVNRLSLGVQTFSDSGLSLLGRDHSGGEARDVAELALGILPNTSLDLIFGWRGQTDADWRADLDTALALGAPHVSTYQLTIEPGTSFAAHEARGNSRASDPDDSARFYETAAETLVPAGLEHYEVSNFARPGHRSRHNLSYWRGEDYVGVGPGAHGRITTDDGRLATLTLFRPADYVASPAPTLDALESQDVATEYIMMGLRTDEGVDRARFVELAGRELDTSGLEDWFAPGEQLVATPEGRRVLDSLTAALLADL